MYMIYSVLIHIKCCCVCWLQPFALSCDCSNIHWRLSHHYGKWGFDPKRFKFWRPGGMLYEAQSYENWEPAWDPLTASMGGDLSGSKYSTPSPFLSCSHVQGDEAPPPSPTQTANSWVHADVCCTILPLGRWVMQWCLVKIETVSEMGCWHYRIQNLGICFRSGQRGNRKKESASGGWTTGYLGYVPAGDDRRTLSREEGNPLANDLAGWPGDFQAEGWKCSWLLSCPWWSTGERWEM